MSRRPNWNLFKSLANLSSCQRQQHRSECYWGNIVKSNWNHQLLYQFSQEDLIFYFDGFDISPVFLFWECSLTIQLH